MNFILYIQIFIFLLLPQSLFSSIEQNVIDLSKVQWEYRWGDTLPWEKSEGWNIIEYPSNPPNREDNTNIWYRVLLPTNLTADPHLYVFSIDLITQVYFENKMIYHFGTFDKEGHGKFQGWPWHMIELPENSAGKYLYFRIYSDYPDIGLWGDILIGSKGYHIEKMLNDDLLRLSAAAIALFVGIIFGLSFFTRLYKIELLLLGSLF